MSYKKRIEAIRNRLNEIKLPHLKLKKLEMNDIIHLDELGLDFTKKNSHARPVPKGGRYEESHYETVKEIFRYGTETFRDRVFILDKDKPRDKEFREYTYGDFREDVEALGTALTAKYMEKGAPLAIIGENQYDWYVSYMTALTGAGIAVPLDKELPDNEIEITLNRSKAEAVIFSAKLKDRILKLREKGRLPYVRTYVVMKSGDLLDDNVVGFDEVVEVAKGADETARTEAAELLEKGFLTTSCCPAFVEYIHVKFPELDKYVSHTLSPMAYTGKAIKEADPNAVVVFIGPCMAKKYERKKDCSKDYIDHVLTFFELQALFDSKGIVLSELEPTDLQDGSSFGRAYCKSGGVAASVAQAVKEMGREDFEVKPVICNGIEECKAALMKAKAGRLDGNIIEGMCCPDGCMRGMGTLVNKQNSMKFVTDYAASAQKKTIFD